MVKLGFAVSCIFALSVYFAIFDLTLAKQSIRSIWPPKLFCHLQEQAKEECPLGYLYLKLLHFYSDPNKLDVKAGDVIQQLMGRVAFQGRGTDVLPGGVCWVTGGNTASLEVKMMTYREFAIHMPIHYIIIIIIITSCTGSGSGQFQSSQISPPQHASFFLKNMHPAFFFTKNHHLPKKSSSAMRFVSHPGLYPSHVMALSRWPIFSALAYFRDTHRGRGRSKKTSTGKQSIRINMNHLLKIYEDINCHQIILFETF